MSNDSPPAKKLPPIVRKVAGKIRRSLFPPPPPPPPPPTPPPPPPIVWVPQLSLSEPLPTLARNVWKHSRLHTDPFRPLPLDNPTARSSATFISPVNEIYQVGALIGTFGRVNHATLVAELYESGTLVASAELSANNFKDNEWNYFTFTPVTGVLNKEITIAFHSPDGSSDNCVAMWETSYGFGSEDRAWSSTPSLDLASPTRATTHFFPWCSLLTYNGQQVKCIGWRGLNHTCD